MIKQSEIYRQNAENCLRLAGSRWPKSKTGSTGRHPPMQNPNDAVLSG